MSRIPVIGGDRNRWGAVMNAFLGEVDASILRGETQVFDLRKYGGVGNSSTNNATALADTLDVITAAGGGVMTLGSASGGYLVSSDLDLVVTVPLIIDLNMQTLLIDADATVRLMGMEISGLAFASDVSRWDTGVTLTDASDVQAGDIIRAVEGTVTESTRNTGRAATWLVESVSGNTLSITPATRMPFSTGATVMRIRPPATPPIIRNGTIKVVNSASFGDTGLWLRGLLAPRTQNVIVTSDDAGKASDGDVNAFGLRPTSCIQPFFETMYAENLAYGISLNGCVGTRVRTMGSKNVRHPVVPQGWSVDTRIMSLSTDDCFATIDSHEAFETHYFDVDGRRDSELSKMDCVGGSIRSAEVYTTADDTNLGPYYHRLVLSDTSWYDDEGAELNIDGYTIIAPNRTTKPSFGANYGRVSCRNVKARVSTANNAFSTNITVLRIDPETCRNPDGTRWSRRSSRKNARLPGGSYVPAVLDAGVYHIDLYSTWVDSADGILRCHGRIVDKDSTATPTYTIRIHTNAFPDRDGAADYPVWVFGVLRLRAIARAGVTQFDLLTQDFHFKQKGSATSNVVFPTTPARVDSLTGQTNESLAITLSNVSAAGASELGTNYPDTYVQFDAGLAAPAMGSPIFGLTYELELIRQTN